MSAAVRLVFRDGGQVVILNAHIHGLREGRLEVAHGEPGQGMSPDIARTVAVEDLDFAMTMTEAGQTGEASSDEADWTMTWDEEEPTEEA